MVVYDDLSGSTHLISAGAAAALEALERHPQGLDLRSLYAEVCDDPDPDADELAAVAAVLTQLEHLRLVTSPAS